MRLLNTETFKVEEFLTGADTDPYAILSHTWEEEEVTFRDIRDSQIPQDIQDCESYEEAKQKAGWKKAGWSKIWHACEYVRRYKFKWIWIDTCCIDKSSSAELSEALNSMYNYYKDGRVCVTYLSDVSMESAMDIKQKLKESLWFTRGWTLQELIAPRFMVFLDADWKMVGTRFSMREIISEKTSIPVPVFENGKVDCYSIAQKMSWAASRKTKREEDMAYCLMGLFGINMPPIYGEGGVKAFMRLQQEIIKYSDDRSIFAWRATDDYHRDRGLFASSPSEFASSGEIGISDSEGLGNDSAFSFGNNGLHIYLPLHHRPGFSEDIYVASLHCQTASDKFVGIYLQKQGRRYIRWNLHFQLPRTDTTSAGLREVVVKESTVAQQQIKKSGYSFPIEFKFDSQITAPDPPPRFFDDIATYDVTGPHDYVIHWFDFLTKKEKKRFFIDIIAVLGTDDIMPVVRVDLRIDGGSPSHRHPPLEDDVVWLVEDDNDYALVSCFTHVTGDCLSKRIVEVNYIPSSNARSQLYHQITKLSTWTMFRLDTVVAMESCCRQIDEFSISLRTLRSISLDFIVDINSSSSWAPAFNLPYSVFPSDISWRRDRKIACGSFPKCGGQCDSHCVFSYELFGWGFVVIALGLRTESNCHLPWIDVNTAQSDIAISDIWESYFPPGSRYKRRQNCMGRTSLDNRWPFTVTVKRNTSIEPGFYHIVIKDEKWPQPDWRPWGDSGTSSLDELDSEWGNGDRPS